MLKLSSAYFTDQYKIFFAILWKKIPNWTLDYRPFQWFPYNWLHSSGVIERKVSHLWSVVSIGYGLALFRGRNNKIWIIFWLTLILNIMIVVDLGDHWLRERLPEVLFGWIDWLEKSVESTNNCTKISTQGVLLLDLVEYKRHKPSVKSIEAWHPTEKKSVWTALKGCLL